jgi:hypothetical protein
MNAVRLAMAIASPLRRLALERRRPRLVPPTALIARLRAVPRPLALILAVGILMSVAWDIAVPAFQGPDEGGHYDYIQYFAETGNLPRVPPPASAERGAGSLELQAAMTYLNLRSTVRNFLQEPAWTGADLQLWHQVERSLPRGARSSGAEFNGLAKNPPLYYVVMSIPYRLLVWLPVLKRLFLMRLFNALFFLGTVALAWLIAGELFGRVRWKQTLMVGTVALEPQLSFLGSVINPDNLLIMLTSAFLLAAIRLVRRGPSLSRVLWATGLSAAAVLTHGRGLVTLPVLLVVLVVTWLKHRPAARESLAMAGASVATIGVAFAGYVLFGKGAGSKTALYGGQVTELTSSHHGFKLGQFLSTVYQFYLPPLPTIPKRLGPRSGYGYRQVYIESFYGTFGSDDTPFTQRLFDAIQVVSALGLGGLYTAVVVRWRQVRRSWPVVAVMLALLVVTVGFLHYVSYRALLENGGRQPLIVGRYLLPLIALFAAAITFTAGALPRRWGPLMGAVILSVGVLLSLSGIGITMVRYYA